MISFPHIQFSMKFFLFGLVTMTTLLSVAQERYYSPPSDLSEHTIMIREYSTVWTDWEAKGLEDERFFRKQQRRWNRQVPGLNQALRDTLQAMPGNFLLVDSAAFGSAIEAGVHYVLESSFQFGLRYDTFLKGEATLDGELVPYYTGPVGQETRYAPDGQVTLPTVDAKNRLYYWRIRDLRTGDEYYLQENFNEKIDEDLGFYGSLPLALADLLHFLD